MSGERLSNNEFEDDDLFRIEGDEVLGYRDSVIKPAMDKLWDGDFLAHTREDDYAMRRRKIQIDGLPVNYEAVTECIKFPTDYSDEKRNPLERIMRIKIEQVQPEEVKQRIIGNYIKSKENVEQIITDIDYTFRDCTALIITEYIFFFDSNDYLEKESNFQLIDRYEEIIYDSAIDDDFFWEDNYDVLDEEIERLEAQIGSSLSRDDLDNIEKCLDILGLS